MSKRTDKATLKYIAAQLAYHANYISNPLHLEPGKFFSEIRLKQNMVRAVIP